MQDSASPARIPLPFAASAGGGYINAIPTLSQIGISNGRASFTDGFVPLNFTPVAAGGVPPFGGDFNGLFNQITAGLQWLQAGGPMPYDATFSTNIGGYPKNAIIMSATVDGKLWRSTADNNTSNPDTGGANWVQFIPSVPFTVPVGGTGLTTLTANGVLVGNGTSAVVTVPLSSRITGAGISTVYTFAGNPNGSVAGVAASGALPPDVCWDTSNLIMWTCVSTGTTSTAVWYAGQTSGAFGTRFVDILSSPSAGSYTVPVGTRLLQAVLIGAGGGTSGSANTSSGAIAGGGGGGTCVCPIQAVTPGQLISYAVGAGGVAVAFGATGGTGGTTTWAGTYSATGGSGGSFASVGSGGTGGAGLINLQGGAGMPFGSQAVGSSGGPGGGAVYLGSMGGAAGTGTAAPGGDPGGGAGGPGSGGALPGQDGGNGRIYIFR